MDRIELLHHHASLVSALRGVSRVTADKIDGVETTSLKSWGQFDRELDPIRHRIPAALGCRLPAEIRALEVIPPEASPMLQRPHLVALQRGFAFNRGDISDDLRLRARLSPWDSRRSRLRRTNHRDDSKLMAEAVSAAEALCRPWSGDTQPTQRG